jgi:hypothetical protein
MPPRWNTWALVQAVQLDYEKAPKERAVRLAAPAASVGDPVRVGISGVEIEGHIARIVGPVLHVKVKAAPLKAKPTRRAKKTA